MTEKQPKICIVIPIYLEKPDALDLLALKSLQRVCDDRYDKFFMCPDGLDTSAYTDVIHLKDIVFFDKKYFESNITYSQLLIRHDFYATFDAYDYMLIYQTDCYIFRNEIEEFASMGYDYIGAPIVSPNSYWPHFKKAQNPICGNGGLSLRKISTFKDICDPGGEIYREYNKNENLYEKVWCEDRFFCDELSSVFELDKPHWKIAARFAYDMNPDVLVDVCGMSLPMGCHAYDKNIRFWKEHIPDVTDEIVQMCEKKHGKWFEKYYHPGDKTYVWS